MVHSGDYAGRGPDHGCSRLPPSAYVHGHGVDHASTTAAIHGIGPSRPVGSDWRPLRGATWALRRPRTSTSAYWAAVQLPTIWCRRFDLRRLYDEPTVSDARKVLAKRSKFSTGRDSLIKISVEDRDPKRAAALANAYVDELYKQNGRLALTESAQRRLFFERQVEAQKKALADAEAALRATQERTGVLQVNSQVESVILSMARLRAEIASREVALSSLEKAATPQNPEVVRQQTELVALREQLQKLEASGDPRRPGDPMILTSQVPKAGLEYVRALRDLKYNETLFELLSKQYRSCQDRRGERRAGHPSGRFGRAAGTKKLAPESPVDLPRNVLLWDPGVPDCTRSQSLWRFRGRRETSSSQEQTDWPVSDITRLRFPQEFAGSGPTR